MWVASPVLEVVDPKLPTWLLVSLCVGVGVPAVIFAALYITFRCSHCAASGMFWVECPTCGIKVGDLEAPQGDG
jgi:hypothetical protein